MTDQPIVTQLPLWTFQFGTRQTPIKPPDLHTLWQFPEYLPPCVTTSPTIMRCFELLSPLDWGHFPERNLERNWGQVTIPFAALAAAELIRLNEGLSSMGRLYTLLIEHPGFIPLLGFPMQLEPGTSLGFNVLARGLDQSGLTPPAWSHEGPKSGVSQLTDPAFPGGAKLGRAL